MHNYTDLPLITVQQIQHFFEHYKDLEGQQVGRRSLGWGDAEEARRCISAGIERNARRPDGVHR